MEMVHKYISSKVSATSKYGNKSIRIQFKFTNVYHRNIQAPRYNERLFKIILQANFTT